MYTVDWIVAIFVLIVLVVIVSGLLFFYAKEEIEESTTDLVLDQRDTVVGPQELVKDAVKVIETAIRVIENVKAEKESKSIAEPSARELPPIVLDDWRLPELPALSDL